MGLGVSDPGEQMNFSFTSFTHCKGNGDIFFYSEAESSWGYSPSLAVLLRDLNNKGASIFMPERLSYPPESNPRLF